MRDTATWPSPDSLGLSAAEIAECVGGIGGSDANTILSGSGERILRLWREKRGEEQPEDLSDRLAVMLGSWAEAFNRQWYEKWSGTQVTRVGERLRFPMRRWRTGTLDGFIAGSREGGEQDGHHDGRSGAIWETKHTSPFSKPEELLQRYMPQHNMAVAGCEPALLSVLFGNGKWEVYEVAADWMHQEDLFEAEMRFWHCVKSGEPPAITVISNAPKPVGVREVSMTGHNAWATFASDWLEHREAAKKGASQSLSSRTNTLTNKERQSVGRGILRGSGRLFGPEAPSSSGRLILVMAARWKPWLQEGDTTFPAKYVARTIR